MLAQRRRALQQRISVTLVVAFLIGGFLLTYATHREASGVRFIPEMTGAVERTAAVDGVRMTNQPAGNCRYGVSVPSAGHRVSSSEKTAKAIC